MAHELSLRADGTAEMFSLRQSPWHNLGRVLTKELKDEEVADAAGMNWSVTENPIYRQIDGAFEMLNDDKVLARSDNNRVLAVVSKEYRVFQNEELIKLMRQIAKDTPVLWETAGVLHYGKTTWCLGYLPELDIRIRETDASKFYMLLTNGHGNMRSLQIMPTLIRVVCANTLQAATVGGSKRRRKNTEDKKFSKAALSQGYGIHHDGQLDAAVADVVNAYEQFMKDKIVTQEIYEQMADTKMSDTDSAEYWNKVFQLEADPLADEAAKAKAMKVESSRLESLQMILASATCKTDATAGTLYGSFNAVTEYCDHVKSVRKREGSNRLSVTQFGTGAKLKEKAFDTALELVNVA
jgi:phage/plasmid-like protein (TIGR03299 family)